MSKNAATFHQLFQSTLIHNFLTENKLTKATDVQAKVIPDIIGGKSLDVVAPTGSGKTYSFLLPIAELLKEDEENNHGDIKKGSPRAVILAPTRELSGQIYEIMKSISHHVKLRIRHVVGGEDGKKTSVLSRQFVDVIVSTPGRLSSAIKKKELSLKNTKYFIIDEADQLLEMGFQKDLQSIYTACDKDLVHIALFSATRPPAFVEWRGKIFHEHLFHQVELSGQNRLHTHIRSFNIYLSERERPLMLKTFMKDQAKGKGVIFVNQQDTVNVLRDLLAKEFPNTVFLTLHGEMEPKERRKVLDQFINKKAILIATDIVARGMDIEDLKWILNYDLPFEAVYYVHRAGRVGRGGKEGEVYNFVTPRDMKIVGRINNAIKNQIALKLTVFDEKKFKPKNSQKELPREKRKEEELTKIKSKMGLDTKKRIAHQLVDGKKKTTRDGKAAKPVKASTRDMDKKDLRRKTLAEKTGYAKTVKTKHTPRFSRRPKSKKK
ncbi:MAG: DEAD/DEAH box helicase [Bacteriovoracaceae bacterium]|nr:DEAD/DEAH box helicase [Bacteriovoracaceae bacterium]